METWRVLATALLGAAGLVLVLVTMAKVRDRTRSGGTVAVSGAIALTLLLLLCVLTLTVFPPALAWGAVVVTGTTVTVMLVAG
ncbi:hypothetical protein [Actinokineospora sp. NBRC 105648]|uniref:hypothetical protein n=1 Tax=Actinokineospora sp. NBRC 105648 TaxID=3032206 RepID=UPI0024A28DC2|nr:hypothetical protein [Actinokineospora sp. NBRC 105648]GLZ40947.1 hypothetical protein Acsp05_45710 [Actinokineospora sp. NBRC 105648]